MKAIIVVCCLALTSSVWGQQFAKTFSADLPDSARSAKVEWVDLDNDGLLDVFTFGTVASGEQFFRTYKTDTIQGLVYQSTLATGFTSAVYHLADFDRDNDMDAIVSGMFSVSPKTSFFENKSGFMFAEHSSLAVGASAIQYADLNANGSGELILSGISQGQSFFHVYQRGTNWKLRNDSLQIEASSIEVFDFDGDSDNDIFVSGKENGLSVSKMMVNQGGFWFTASTLPKGGDGNTAVADLNHDGQLDVFLSGTNSSGQPVSIQYLNSGDSFVAKDTLAPLLNGVPFLADFNSDGKCDIHLVGTNLAGDTLNSIVFRDSVTMLINKSALHQQAFGDYDRDGDLDLVQIVDKTSSLQIQLSKNDFAAKNLGPHGPGAAVGFTIFNKLFLHWDRALDDHTPRKAITYDVTIFMPHEDLMVGEFDLISNKRLTVSHGNSGAKNYLIIKPGIVSAFNYAVQPIDNSFESYRHKNEPRNPGLCTGTGSPCASQQLTEVPACKNENLAFTAGPGAQWYSLSKGFLAEGSTFETKALAPDTIFSFNIQDGCPSLKIYLIQLRQNFIRKTNETRYVCEGSNIPLQVDPAWESIQWKSHVRGALATTPEINYVVAQSDTVTVKAMNADGCGIEHKTTLRVSKPVITLEGEIYQILKGESVQFSASGGERYRWTPAETLDDSNIANPTASPVTSTIYTVEVTDSIACTAQANVQVIVEGTAFIPTLFTPNDDGKNDELKVYGLSTVSNFKFVIHNREGSVLYETKDLARITASGWDGTSRGVKQPAGVYYWKVMGEHPSGRKLLLNGKATGSIVLIR